MSPEDGLNAWAARRIWMTGTAGCTMAATRIVECIPPGDGVMAAGIHAGGSRRPTATRGLIAAPWTPVSLSLLPESKDMRH
jgi:hypothetical protein